MVITIEELRADLAESTAKKAVKKVKTISSNEEIVGIIPPEKKKRVRKSRAKTISISGINSSSKISTWIKDAENYLLESFSPFILAGGCINVFDNLFFSPKTITVEEPLSKKELNIYFNYFPANFKILTDENWDLYGFASNNCIKHSEIDFETLLNNPKTPTLELGYVCLPHNYINIVTIYKRHIFIQVPFVSYNSYNDLELLKIIVAQIVTVLKQKTNEKDAEKNLIKQQADLILRSTHRNLANEISNQEKYLKKELKAYVERLLRIQTLKGTKEDIGTQRIFAEIESLKKHPLIKEAKILKRGEYSGALLELKTVHMDITINNTVYIGNEYLIRINLEVPYNVMPMIQAASIHPEYGIANNALEHPHKNNAKRGSGFQTLCLGSDTAAALVEFGTIWDLLSYTETILAFLQTSNMGDWRARGRINGTGSAGHPKWLTVSEVKENIKKATKKEKENIKKALDAPTIPEQNAAMLEEALHVND